MSVILFLAFRSVLQLSQDVVLRQPNIISQGRKDSTGAFVWLCSGELPSFIASYCVCTTSLLVYAVLANNHFPASRTLMSSGDKKTILLFTYGYVLSSSLMLFSFFARVQLFCWAQEIVLRRCNPDHEPRSPREMYLRRRAAVCLQRHARGRPVRMLFGQLTRAVLTFDGAGEPNRYTSYARFHC